MAAVLRPDNSDLPPLRGLSATYSLRVVDESAPDESRLHTATSRNVAIVAYLVGGIIWIIAGTTAVSEFDAVGVRTVLAIFFGIAAAVVGAAALVYCRNR